MESPANESLLEADVESATKEYRPKDSQWWVGVACTSIFAVATVGSVALALWNPDGSFPSPILFAAVFGLSWGGFTLLSAWILANYYRSRLVISREGAVQVGVFRSAGIEFDDVQEARWRAIPVGGSLKLRDAKTRMTIEFARCTTAERDELIERFRSLIRLERQVGWEEFYEGTAKREMDPRRALVSSLVMAGIFGAFAVAPFVIGPRGWIQGPDLMRLAVPNVLGVGLAGHRAWRAWRRMRAEGRRVTDDCLALAAGASEKRR